MIRFVGITEIFRLIFRQCFTTSPDIYLVADVLDQSASIWSSSVMWRRRLQSFNNLPMSYLRRQHSPS